jgi:hypothetical protein
MLLPGEHTAKLSAICTKHGVVLALENGTVNSWTYSRPTGPPTSSPASAGHFFVSNGKHRAARCSLTGRESIST